MDTSDANGAQRRDKSQFALLKSRRFLPFFLTQFCGALNDNLYKNALLVILVSGFMAGAGGDTDVLVNTAAALFVLPFFLFSALAGQLADKYEKSRIIRYIKVAEILIMLTGALALWTHQLWLLFAVLFAMGVHSTFFGPVKYALLPQHLYPEELIGGNAQVEMGTFVAILVGTIIGSLLGGLAQPIVPVSAAIVAVALLGWLCSRQVPVAEAKAPALRIDWNPLRESVALLRMASEKRAVLLSILGISWFWLIGAGYLTQVPNFATAVLGGQASLIALLLSVFTIGIAVGSLLCERMSGHKIEIGLVPFGSIGLSLFGIDLYFAAEAYRGLAGVSAFGFLVQPGAGRILLDLMLIGAFGGFYIVPLYALVQARTAPEKRARVIACNNILNAVFMVASSLLGALFLGPADGAIPMFYLLLALMNIAVAVFIYQQVPEFTMRFLVWLLSHSLYRVRHENLHHIPDEGAALIACNHVSFVDALLLAGAVRRPIRFIMYRPIYDIPVLNFIFRVGEAIPICSPKEDEQRYRDALDEIAAGLERGDLLCIFPEGKLTRDGELDRFRRGIERIVRRTPVPVIPVALRGLWGSFFSHSGRGAFKSPFQKIWRRVTIAAAQPVAATDVNVDDLHNRVLALRGPEK